MPELRTIDGQLVMVSADTLIEEAASLPPDYIERILSRHKEIRERELKLFPQINELFPRTAGESPLDYIKRLRRSAIVIEGENVKRLTFRTVTRYYHFL